jgi:C4-dicarboxylate-specific signal transduction histidine kinase
MRDHVHGFDGNSPYRRKYEAPTVESEVGEELPKISVDPIQVQEVLINLITNAMEAMEGGHRDPRLMILATVDRREMSIQVIDNGPGMDDPEKLFEAFISTKKEGMGIGLVGSRSIVEAHGGATMGRKQS